MSQETDLQNRIRCEAARQGSILWRNNSGVAFDHTGRPVRFGLGNDSKEANEVCKSSDLIGVTPVICPCGLIYGVFTAYEIKKPSWIFRGTKREHAQLNFLNVVTSHYGLARFINKVEDL